MEKVCEAISELSNKAIIVPDYFKKADVVFHAYVKMQDPIMLAVKTMTIGDLFSLIMNYSIYQEKSYESKL